MTIDDLRSAKLPAKSTKLSAEQVAERLKVLGGWELAGGEIAKTYRFENYYQTMAFVNAVAWLAHRADHHPDMEVGYNRCRVRYSTHSVGGISESDFICAAQVESLQGK